MNNKIKNRIVFYTMLLVLFVIVNIVVSFAYLRGRANNNESVSTIAIKGVGNIKVVYSGNTSNIVVEDILPGYETVKNFTVTSNISSGGVVYNRGIWYQIKLIVDTNEFMSGSLTYSLSLDDNSSTDGITALPVDKIAIPNGANSDGILIGTGYFSSDNVSHTYNLKINYVNLEDVDQSSDYQKKFAAHVVIDNPGYVNLTFDLVGGRFENLNLNRNSTMKVAANSIIDFPIPIKENYTFAGWEVVSGNVSVDNTSISTGSNDITLKVLWSKGSFDYTGGEQQFIAEVPGYYKLETWGAQGGAAIPYDSYISSYPTYQGGYGGYSVGVYYLNKNNVLYINIGGNGSTLYCDASNTVSGGYNGGGSARCGDGQGTISDSRGSGGGATHIAISTGLLSEFSSKVDSLVIVSGGGGGSIYYNNSNNYVSAATGGHGGGFSGGNSTNLYRKNDGNVENVSNNYSLGGLQETQTISSYNGVFGQGGDYVCGGGGGYYGGATKGYAAGGGSGYIGNTLLTDKYMYCYNCITSDVENTKTFTTTCAEETPTENCAKIGNGFARITFLHS